MYDIYIEKCIKHVNIRIICKCNQLLIYSVYDKYIEEFIQLVNVQITYINILLIHVMYHIYKETRVRLVNLQTIYMNIFLMIYNKLKSCMKLSTVLMLSYSSIFFSISNLTTDFHMKIA